MELFGSVPWEGLASWKGNRLTTYPELARQNVVTLLEDREGTVWAGSFGVPRGKLCVIQPGVVKCYGDDRSLGQWVWSIYEDREGRIWAGTETGLWRWRPGPPKRYSMPHPIETSEALLERDKGPALLAVAERIWQFADEKVSGSDIAMPSGDFTPLSVFRDRDGGLWVGTLQQGVLHVHEKRTSVFGQSDGLSSDHVLTFFEDREGNIWVGTANGLDRFRQTTVTSISVKQGLSNPSVVAVLAARDNTVWLSTLDGLNRWDNGRVTIYMPFGRAARNEAQTREFQQIRPAVYTDRLTKNGGVTEIADPGLPDNTVGSLYEDKEGRIWVSTPKGIARFENGRFKVVKEVPGGWVNAIVGDSDAGIWISYQDLGLLHLVGGKVVERVPWSRLGGNVIASSVVSDPVKGGLWLGFFQGGVVHFKDGQMVASYTSKDGLGTGRVMGLQLDKDGTLWAATEGGLSRIRDGRIGTLNSSNGLPCDTVHWTVEIGGSFWMYTACGLVRIARSELEKWASDPKLKIEPTVLHRSDGVRSRALLTGYTPRFSESADGRLWFTDLQSVSVLDPRHLSFNDMVPPVHIEQIVADGKTYEPGGVLHLHPRVRDLAIEYTALSFAVPDKVRFRYKLEGQDQDWREVVNDREVQYSNLAPGNYRFRVIACNNSGVWNKEGDTLQIVIPPAWYQTNWFVAACFAVFLAMVWGIHQVRVHQLSHQFNLTLEARIAERTRIARDLHDTLLQSFQGLLLHFQAALNLLPERPVDARQTLEDAVQRAGKAVTEGRDAVQGLRMSVVETNDLALAIRTVGEELASADRNPFLPEFTVVVEGKGRNLHPILRDEVYRIATEALRNAFRHAAAHKVEVEIRYDEKYFRLRVRDDGKGIRDEVLQGHGRGGHYGLHGMKERAALVGGNLTIWSEADSGTEIELLISAMRAYGKPTWRFWEFGKRSVTESDVKETIDRE